MKNGNVQKKRRFNVVDFLLIVLVLAIIGGVIYLFLPGSVIRNMGSSTSGSLSYTVELKGVDSVYLNKIKENDIVVDSVSKTTIGTVTAVDYNTKYTVLEYTEKDGQYEGVLADYPDRYNVLVTITTTAEYTPKKGYSVSGCRIAVGEALNLRFPDFAYEGHCISLVAEDFS